MKKNLELTKEAIQNHLKEKVLRLSNGIRDLRKREEFRSQILGKSYNPAESSAFDIELGRDTPPGSSQPVNGGAGVPGGQLPYAEDAGDQNGDVNAGCPLCGEEGLDCACTRNMAKMVMNPAPAMAMSEKNPGANKDPSKKQPLPPVAGAKLAPEKTKEIPAEGSGGDPKKGKMAKTGVSEAKPPSGKVPGASKAPPIASNTSAPQIKEEMEKGALSPGDKKVVQSQMVNDAFKNKPVAPAVKPPNPVGDQLDALMGKPNSNTMTPPSDMSRANMYSAFTPSAANTGMRMPVPAPGRAAVPRVGTAVAPVAPPKKQNG